MLELVTHRTNLRAKPAPPVAVHMHGCQGSVWHVEHLSLEMFHRHPRPPPTRMEQVQAALHKAHEAIEEREREAELSVVHWLIRLAVRRARRKLGF